MHRVRLVPLQPALRTAKEHLGRTEDRLRQPDEQRYTDDHGDDHHPEPIPQDPDLPDVSKTTLGFFAAGALVVFTVSMVALFG